MVVMSSATSAPSTMEIKVMTFNIQQLFNMGPKVKVLRNEIELWLCESNWFVRPGIGLSYCTIIPNNLFLIFNFDTHYTLLLRRGGC